MVEHFLENFRSFTLQLSSAKDIAVLVTLPIAKGGKITASARVDGKYTSEVDRPIFLPLEMKFTLHLRISQFVIEIYFNDNHVLDFVHRVNPTEIKEVHIEGPLIVEEVVFTPPQGASLDPLPSYEQATSMGSDPIKEFRHLNIGPPTSSLTPTPVPAAGSGSSPVLVPTPAPPPIGLSTAVVNQPMAGIPLPSGVVVLHKTAELPEPGIASASTSTNPFVSSSPEKFPALAPAGALSSKPTTHENNPNFVPTAFVQAQRYTPVSSTASPYVTSPTPTPAPTPAPAPYPTSSGMPVLQPTSFQQTPLPSQQFQATPYPSSSQALQPLPPTGPVAGMPYPQLMPQPPVTGQPYGANVNHYQYPVGVPGQQGVAMHPHYNPYQQTSPYPYQVPPAAYVPGLIFTI
ncbi:galactoside-binding lectin [Ancylostoma caninum]|uniref:Galectin n=1 Tax=Ancylostoma caninum TaxID=29170 RepID=A0A368H824_ANCCA|nr:galactoside-binding lectin [Ancylostoma caninum]